MSPDEMQTPAYVYDLAEIRRAFAMLSGALPQPSGLCYSLKANPHPDVVATLCELGTDAEVSSPGELAAALAAGYRSDQVLYTGPGKRDADLGVALRAGVSAFSADSPSALDQLDRLATQYGAHVRCLLRVNDDRPAGGQRLTMTGRPSQFGADKAWIMAEPERFRDRARVKIAGLHFYMGSNLPTQESLLAQFTQAITTAQQVLRVLGIEPAVLDLGGGFSAPFARAGELPRFPDLADRLAASLDEAWPRWRDAMPRIVFESGRYLVARCGQLLTRVLDVKHSQGLRVLVLESGINHLGGMSGLRRLAPIMPDLIAAASLRPLLTDTLITGPLCTPLDNWGSGVNVSDVVPGDLVAVPNVGAYGLYASLVAFLGHPLPVEVVIDDGRLQNITQMRIHREAL
jgi:diaminopimelate decarboxylase